MCIEAASEAVNVNCRILGVGKLTNTNFVFSSKFFNMKSLLINLKYLSKTDLMPFKVLNYILNTETFLNVGENEKLTIKTEVAPGHNSHKSSLLSYI